MPRYWLFGGERHYPGGGAKDMVDAFADLDSALMAGQRSGHDWWNVLDAGTGSVYEPSDQNEPDVVPPEEVAKAAEARAARESREESEKAHAEEFNRRFDAVGADDKALLARRCKLGGHEPISDLKPLRKGARSMVTCACGQRLYEQQGAGYARVIGTDEMIKGLLKRGKR